MEFLVIDSSVLITSSLLWKYTTRNKQITLKQKKFGECEALFNLITKNSEDLICVITKTVETQAVSVLKKAVNNLLSKNRWRIKDILKKYNYYVLRNIIHDRSLDRMENIIEEHSTRFPISKKNINKIIRNEIEPFFNKTLPNTLRYCPVPKIIKRMPGPMPEKRWILDKIKSKILPGKIIYIKGEPDEKDKRIMAEAVYICRTHKKKKIFIASLDYHFIPNPTQIDSYLSPLYLRNFENMNTGMRDSLMKEFGFFSDRPKELIKIFEKMGFNIN